MGKEGEKTGRWGNSGGKVTSYHVQVGGSARCLGRDLVAQEDGNLSNSGHEDLKPCYGVLSFTVGETGCH